MVDNQKPYGEKQFENIQDNFIQYGLPYKKNGPDINYDYYRSSSSSSSSGSGKVLVHRLYSSPYETSRYNPIYQEELTATNISSLNLENEQNNRKFHIGGYLQSPVSPQFSGNGFYKPEPTSPGLLTVPQFPGLDTIQDELSGNSVGGTRDNNLLASPGKLGSITETFWQIPRANLWCSKKDCLKEGKKCSECQLREETTSNCSSENPPPTFTALDNIHPMKRRKKWCKCAVTCLTTSTFCLLVLSMIAGYILYVEVVLRRKQYVPDPM